MGHGISKNDMVLGCTKDAEGNFETDWHGLTIGVDELNDEAVRPLLFNIIERPSFSDVDGIQVVNPNGKNLIADLRDVRPGLAPEDALIHLHNPKNGYKVIPNRDVWEAAKRSVADVDGSRIERVFTLENLSKFGVSISIGEKEIGVKRFNGDVDKTLCQLNVITSHDGTFACEAYDSTIRIVCMNTLRWSRDAAGDVGFKVYHTKNAGEAMVKFPELVNAILKGRVRFKNQMEYLDTLPITKDEALYVTLFFLARNLSEEKKNLDGISTRILNAGQSISDLFVNGKGNLGKTVLDLLNGGTEYWTGGDGTGMKASSAEKAFKADYGKAADHKEDFSNFLMGNLEIAKELGRKLYVDAMKEA